MYRYTNIMITEVGFYIDRYIITQDTLKLFLILIHSQPIKMDFHHLKLDINI
jgi:hypothetical protein